MEKAAVMTEYEYTELLKQKAVSAAPYIVKNWKKEYEVFSGDIFRDGCMDNETVYFTKGKIVKKDGKIQYHMQGLAGSPLYIALCLKMYDEAGRILKAYPATVSPGYAVFPIKLVFDNETEIPEVSIEMKKGIYLENMVFSDRNIPDSLFLELCNALVLRESTKEYDRPCRYKKVEDPEGSKIPVLFMDLPDRIFLEEKYNESGLTRTLFHSYPSFSILRRSMNSEQEKELTEKMIKTAAADLKAYHDILSGMRRFRKLDVQSFEKLVDERMAAFLFLAFARRLYTVIHFMRPKYEAIWNAHNVDKITQITGDCNVEDEFRRFKREFKHLGYKTISADVLWTVIRDHMAAAVGGENEDTIWIYYVLWNEIFDNEMIFHMDEPDDKMSVLFGLSRSGRKEEWNRKRSMELLDLIDEIKWSADEEVSSRRRELEKQIICEADKEYLYNSFEKNLIPMEDAEFIVEYLEEKEDKSDLLPLLVMHRYGCFEKEKVKI